MIRSKKDQLEGRIKKFVANIYTKNHWDMSEKLKRFTELLDNEDDKKGDGLTEVKKILEKVDEIYNIKSFESLEGFLFSTELNPPIGDQVHQDMNAPLSHYFIHTSLNSYFTGNRVYPKYSIEPIIDALRQGVRVVELDLWPCGKDGICVRPSWNIEKPLQLQDCLDSIKEYAFTLTDYPVIITFKDSLKTDLQSKAIQMINQTFENMVYHHSSEEFPSPEQLRNKILISRRPPKELLYANDAEETLDVRNGVELRHESEDPNYQSLVAFNAVEPGGMLRKALTDKAENIQRPGWYETDVIRFTQNKFLRTRPKRKLLIYAPYKPQRAWMHGAQMIALSRQDDKEKLWLMQGMFRANGGCGYVKKPDFLLDASPSRLSGVFYPTVDPSVEKTLKVKVYMGDGWLVDFKKHIGRLSNPDLYVMISIAGVAHDENTMKTAVKYNEWTPTWGQEFTFRLTYPDLALLRIEVYNHEVSSADGFCGQTCLPVSELIEGIRAVPLYDEKGEACSSTMLLIRFKWS